MKRNIVDWNLPAVAGMLAILATACASPAVWAQERESVSSQANAAVISDAESQPEPDDTDSQDTKWNFGSEAVKTLNTAQSDGVDDQPALESETSNKIAETLIEDADDPASDNESDDVGQAQAEADPNTGSDQQAIAETEAPAPTSAQTARQRLAVITGALNPELPSTNTGDTTSQEDGVVATDRLAVNRAGELERRQQRSNLEQQYAKLRKTLETADAFSPELGEDYFGYGMLLRENGQYDEAIDAFVDALHIQKVNNGIYAPEQRAALKALFETHYALGNVEEFEDYLQRILWIENKNPDLNDEFSYRILVMVGNQYIDQFLRKPVAQQQSVETLLRAKNHFNAAVRYHAHKPLDVVLMPYGELALISFLENQLLPNVDRTASMEDARLRSSRDLSGRELALFSYLNNSFPRGHALLRSYLVKAQKEEQRDHVIAAMIALGDFNQLFKRHSTASDLYRAAWQEVQREPVPELDADFDAPLPLPAFSYSQQRNEVLPDRPTTLIPLILDINDKGRVIDVKRDELNEDQERYFARAKRVANRLIFRPRIVDGEPVATTGVPYKARVYARR